MLEDEGSPSETSHNSSAGIISRSITCKTRETSPGHSRAATSARIHMDRFISNSCMDQEQSNALERIRRQQSLINSGNIA
jgi:hypothetical protein